jgi:hypothetical protein
LFVGPSNQCDQIGRNFAILATLGYFGLLWATLAYFGLLWATFYLPT